MDEQRTSDQGETLIELLVAMLVMGIAIVALVGGLGTSVRISEIHRKQALAGAYLRSFAEAVQTAIAKSPTDYRECATNLQYEAAFRITDAPYRANVEHVRYWDGSTFGASCTAATDSGVQLLSLTVRSTDDDAVESLDLIIRKPCRPMDAFPAEGTCR